jgi:hypothetical protein
MKTLATEHHRAEIFRRVRALRPDSQRRWGRMSVHQMVCHLSDGYRILASGRTNRPVPTPLPRPIMKAVALYILVPWPRGLPTTPELDQADGGTQPGSFERDVAELERLLVSMTTELRGRLDGQEHPAFGRMSESAWLRWAYLHADHHLRQFSG